MTAFSEGGGLCPPLHLVHAIESLTHKQHEIHLVQCRRRELWSLPHRQSVCGLFAVLVAASHYEYIVSKFVSIFGGLTTAIRIEFDDNCQCKWYHDRTVGLGSNIFTNYITKLCLLFREHLFRVLWTPHHLRICSYKVLQCSLSKQNADEVISWCQVFKSGSFVSTPTKI